MMLKEIILIQKEKMNVSRLPEEMQLLVKKSQQ